MDKEPHYIAASNEDALRFERLQSEVGEGPCIAAYESQGPIAVADLETEERFVHFTPRAVAAGLRAVFTLPLRHDDGCLGALDLYRQEAGALDEENLAAAQTLADVVTAYLLNIRAREEVQGDGRPPRAQRAPRPADLAPEPAVAPGANRAGGPTSTTIAHHRSGALRRP